MPDALMIFAAGLGTRMRPLTDHLPKPLIPVGGQTLLDRAIALGRAGGARRIVVNTHYLAPMIDAHLAGSDVVISHEPGPVLETGGGLRQARPLLGGGAVLTLNPDVVWTGTNPVAALRTAWDGARMDALLMLVPLARATARAGGGDFDIDGAGRIARRGDFVYGGAQIINPALLDAIPQQVFSLNRCWDAAISSGRAFGLIHPGGWCDVGRPDAIPLAEALLSDG
ncbi:MAG: nucleotidyltransferase family protein [Paracoccus sp. (in: a-proteobacteria)]|nr:nucleotidyltransferase family protein [Paracoccus sp. (in: a-proteobacteria)]